MTVEKMVAIQDAIERLLAGAEISTIDSKSLHQYLNQEGWTIHPVYHQKRVVGAIVERDGVLHTSIAPEFQKKWNPRPYIKTILYPALDKYGVIYSDAAKDDLRGIRWLTKLGFVYQREDQTRIYYELREKRF